ncbi:MAG: class II fructose-bisphosphate aldolase [Streptosporangiaceae bacterium]
MIVPGAEQAGRPAVLQIRENCVKYYCALEPIALAVARAATVPVAVHFDHANVTYDLALRYETERHPTEKHRIVAVAAGMVRPGQVAERRDDD